MRFVLALKLFWRALFDSKVASRLEVALSDTEPSTSTTHPSPIESKPAASKPAASKLATPQPATAGAEAVELLATLQREARFVDLVKESLTHYTDAQVGAAARDVLRDCGMVLDRLFGLQPATDQQEGSRIEVPTGYSPLRFRLTGKVAGQPPFRGTVVHPGWKVTRTEVPTRVESTDAAEIVAPIEVELS